MHIIIAFTVTLIIYFISITYYKLFIFLNTFLKFISLINKAIIINIPPNIPFMPKVSFSNKLDIKTPNKGSRVKIIEICVELKNFWHFV